MHTPHTIISLGASLSMQEAKKIYPDACYHRPFQCGDLIKLIRLSPQRIAIIDGMFEHRASVWHKEILWALSLGIEVYGASSMGALRATEMKTYGMQAVGLIAERYTHNLTLDDDEIAVTEDAKGQSTTVTLIDLYQSLLVLETLGYISATRRIEIQEAAKIIPYFKRLGTALPFSNTEYEAFLQHRVHQKQKDTYLLLTLLAQHHPNTVQRPNMVESIYFRQAYRHFHHAPFDQAYAWLPQHEQQYATLTRPYQTVIAHYSKLLQLTADRLSQTQSFEEQPARSILLHACPITIDHAKIRHHLAIFYRLSFPHIPWPEAMLDEMACLFDHLLQDLIHHDCLLDLPILKNFSNHWRKQFNLQTIRDTEAWQKREGLTNPAEYARFIYHMSCFNFFVLKNTGEAILYRGPLWRNHWIAEILTDYAVGCSSSR